MGRGSGNRSEFAKNEQENGEVVYKRNENNKGTRDILEG